MSLSSNDLNYLLWRYLQESGFELTAYSFQRESEANKQDDRLGEVTPIGALVRMVQKGIQLTEIESQIRKVGRDRMDKDMYSLLSSLQLDQELTKPTELVAQNGSQLNGGDVEMKDAADEDRNGIKHSQIQVELEKPVVPMRELKPSLELQEASLYSQWSPTSKTTLLYGGYGLRAYILQLDETLAQVTGQQALHHNTGIPQTEEQEKEMTALGWNSNGELVASASFDGQVKLWTGDGRLRHTLSLHHGPVLAAQWNKGGTLLLTIDCHNTAAIWDGHMGTIRQHHGNRTAPAAGTDADWIDDETYALTSDEDDSVIVVRKVGEDSPLLRFQGHTKPINTLRFDEQTRFLASGADDSSIRIWHGSTSSPVAVLTGHHAGVMVVRWVPTNAIEALVGSGPQSGKTKRALLLSASADGTLKLWNAELGELLVTLAIHESAVFCCEVSPNGKYAASGGADGVLIVWDLSQLDNNEKSGADRAIARYQYTPENANDAGISTISWSCDSSHVFVGLPGKSLVIKATE